MPKLRIGSPPQSPFLGDATWNSIVVLERRPLLWSLCIGIGLAVGIALAWRLVAPGSLPFGAPTWIDIAVVTMTLALGHEALHLLGFPNAGLDANTVVGVWPELGSPYVQYLSPMARNRFLFAVLLPFLALTVLPFLLVLKWDGQIAVFSWISVLNCVGAGSDIFIFVKMLALVPDTAFVLESGHRLYWRRH
jgi:hypothetical protein